MAGERGLTRDREADDAGADDENLHADWVARSADAVEPIEAFRSAEEQIGFVRGAGALGQQLAGVPKHRIAVRTFVDGEIAFEHPTRWAEDRNASFDVRPPGIRKRLRGWRIGVSLKAEAPDAHTEPAKLYEDVRPLRQRFDRFLP